MRYNKVFTTVDTYCTRSTICTPYLLVVTVRTIIRSSILLLLPAGTCTVLRTLIAWSTTLLCLEESTESIMVQEVLYRECNAINEESHPYLN